MGIKASDAEMKLRIQEVERLLIEGKRLCEIVDYAEITWQIGATQTETYVRRAWERIKDSGASSREDYKSQALTRLHDTIRRAIEKKDIHAEIKALALMAKITGIELAPADQSPRATELPDEALDKAWQEEAVH